METTPCQVRTSGITEAQTASDRLLNFREVNQRLGLRCQTSHTARAFAARGQIKAVRINPRVLRYTESSVNRLVSGLQLEAYR